VIRSEAEYQMALDEVAGLMDAVPGTPEEARLNKLADEIIVYEEKHYPIGDSVAVTDTPVAVAWTRIDAALEAAAEALKAERAADDRWFTELLEALIALKVAMNTEAADD